MELQNQEAQSLTLANQNTRRTFPAQYVRSMFDSIAHRYDFLNHTLSGGMDILWRKNAVALLAPFEPDHILDIATGTGDFAIAATSLHPSSIIGMDISHKMLELAQKKIAKKNLLKIISLAYGTAEHIPYPDASFDAVTVGFGIRNFENLLQGLSEIYRVLRKNGVAAILEFSHPRHFPFKQLYKFYSATIIPLFGAWMSGNKEAYTYLPDTIAEFPSCETLSALLRSVGFASVRCYPKTFGIVTIYIAEKKEL